MDDKKYNCGTWVPPGPTNSTYIKTVKKDGQETIEVYHNREEPKCEAFLSMESVIETRDRDLHKRLIDIGLLDDVTSLMKEIADVTVDLCLKNAKAEIGFWHSNPLSKSSEGETAYVDRQSILHVKNILIK
jgi:hypothetical protein